MVINIHSIFVGMKNRLCQPGYLDLIIPHPFNSDSRPLGQDRRAIPDIEDEEAAGVKMLAGGLNSRYDVLVGGLVADDMEEGDHRVKGFSQTNGTDISLGEDETGCFTIWLLFKFFLSEAHHFLAALHTLNFKTFLGKENGVESAP